jgi:hypothetical protein
MILDVGSAVLVFGATLAMASAHSTRSAWHWQRCAGRIAGSDEFPRAALSVLASGHELGRSAEGGGLDDNG